MATATKKRPPKNKTAQTSGKGVKPPIMGTTHYDKVSSSMIAVVMALILGVIVVVVIWLQNRLPPVPEPVMLEYVVLGGGFEDGNPDDTWELDTPEEEVMDPEIEEVVDNIIELVEQATVKLEERVASDVKNTGTPGSASGSGRPLGRGQGGIGFGREKRWFVRFADKSDLNTYASQLDFFRIELAVRKKAAGQVIYLKNLKAARPTKTVVKGVGSETRMYMAWRGGNRRQADIALFKRAGVSVTSSDLIVHFYPKATENMLAKLEYNYKKRLPDQIRRTHFDVRGSTKFEFVVTKQTLQIGKR